VRMETAQTSTNSPHPVRMATGEDDELSTTFLHLPTAGTVTFEQEAANLNLQQDVRIIELQAPAERAPRNYVPSQHLHSDDAMVLRGDGISILLNHVVSWNGDILDRYSKYAQLQTYRSEWMSCFRSPPILLSPPRPPSFIQEDLLI